MQWHRTLPTVCSVGRASSRRETPLSQRHHHTTKPPRTPTLVSWELDTFRRQAFLANAPCCLRRDSKQLPRACSQWFVHDSNSKFDLSGTDSIPETSELRADFWSQYEDVLVPLELSAVALDGTSSASFHRAQAPLKLLLAYLSTPPSSHSTPQPRGQSIYLAQCPLPSLPSSLLAAVPTPEIVLQAGKGDVYDSSLWLGRPPTNTPLHRDPNPNFFIQLAGQKKVRLLPPEVGDAIFERIQEAVQAHSGGRAIRGEEMMVGPERQLLDAGVWAEAVPADGDIAGDISKAVEMYGQEAELSLGDALFIPKGWWHSVRGVGQGITASVNWWFR